jgi:hypothetical protein
LPRSKPKTISRKRAAVTTATSASGFEVEHSIAVTDEPANDFEVEHSFAATSEPVGNDYAGLAGDGDLTCTEEHEVYFIIIMY